MLPSKGNYQQIREFIIVFIIYIGQGKFQDTKGETEAVNQRTNNIMVKRKGTKGQQWFATLYTSN